MGPGDKTNLTASASIFDAASLATLKRQAKAGDPAANKAVARQFEALFLQMVLKSMRDATPRDGIFESDQTRMYESLLDQQLTQNLGGGNRGTGLAAMIEAQLARQNQESQPFEGPLPLQRLAPSYPLPQGNGPSVPRAVPPAPTFPGSSAAPTASAQLAFVDRVLPAAVAAERSLGIPAQFMVAQAALETGWGKSEPRRADGSRSFNIFGIKAGSHWHGPTTDATTVEVVAGETQTRVERFRAYGSYEEAFRDYANLLAGNPRYAAVLGAQDSTRFARGLQAAGYATDPFYASKLERIIGSAALSKG